MVDEARLESTDYGVTPVSDGWFVVNVADAAWVHNDALGAACIFEGEEVSFPDLGYTIAVLQPGQSGGRYHREANQEDFLVLVGECLLLIEGEERLMKTWDFVHFPPNTEHAVVGAGDGPCVIFMTGARAGWPDNKGLVYPRSELALRHGAGVETTTTDPREAYAPFPEWQPGPGLELTSLFPRYTREKGGEFS
jgi:quercetin dioxygenase-like cupin family protein